jgi:transcriptional regulator with XRE-family HTH domain
MVKAAENVLAKNVGRAIAQQRARAQMTQEEVAARLNIGNEAVSRIERGVAMPSIQRLYELADVLGCEAMDLLTNGSTHVDDQVRHLKQMMEPLSSDDRELVLRLVEQLSARLTP